jgi:hypothetical protein
MDQWNKEEDEEGRKAEEPMTVFVSEPIDESRIPKATAGERADEVDVTEDVSAEPPEQVRPVEPGEPVERVEPVVERPSFGARASSAFMTFLKWLGIFLAGGLVGALLIYLLLYRPTDDALRSVNTQLSARQQELNQTQEDLEASQTDLEGVQTENEALQTTIDRMRVRSGLLEMMAQVREAQIALVSQDTGSAQRALRSAQQELSDIQEDLEAENPEVANSVDLRLELAMSEVAREPDTALADLDILHTNLNLLERLFDRP